MLKLPLDRGNQRHTLVSRGQHVSRETWVQVLPKARQIQPPCSIRHGHDIPCHGHSGKPHRINTSMVTFTPIFRNSAEHIQHRMPNDTYKNTRGHTLTIPCERSIQRLPTRAQRNNNHRRKPAAPCQLDNNVIEQHGNAVLLPCW